MMAYLSKKCGVSHLYIVILTLVGCFAQPVLAACEPNANAVLLDEPYYGYSNTGYRGAMEPDMLWQAHVQHINPDEEPPLFVFKSNPSVQFANIEPIYLGGKSTGFIVTRQGCKQLYSEKGKALLPTLFKEYYQKSLSEATYGKGQTLVVLKSEEKGPLFIRFSHGRLLGVKRVGKWAYSRPFTEPIKSRVMQQYFAPFIVNDRSGLFDLRDLKEVLAPEWGAIGGININGSTHFLMTKKDGLLTVHSLDGKTVLLEGITHAEVRDHWFPYDPNAMDDTKAVVFIRKQGEAGCYLLNSKLQSLTPYPVPLASNEQCGGGSRRGFKERPYLFTVESEQTVHAYTIAPEGKLALLSSVKGKLEAGFENTGLMVVRVLTEQGTVYRTYDVNGKRNNAEDFTNFRFVGCGIMQVKRSPDGAWLTLFRDGEVSTKKKWAFGC